MHNFSNCNGKGCENPHIYVSISALKCVSFGHLSLTSNALDEIIWSLAKINKYMSKFTSANYNLSTVYMFTSSCKGYRVAVIVK